MNIIIRIRQMWSGRFSAVLAFVLMAVCQGNAKDGTTLSTRKIFEQEIEVPTGTTIRTEGPGSPDLHLTGTMNSSSEIGAYTLKGKGGELVMKIDRKFHIFTWDKNVVKHKVVVNIEADNATMEKEILDALTMSLQLAPDNSLEIDCFLGIQKITMRNGWFRGNDNTLIMRSGKQIKFRSLTISSILTIPKNSNLDLKTRYVDVTLGTLNGTANLDLTGSFFTAEYIQNLQAKLRSTELTVNKTETASVSAHNSKVMILAAEQIDIGKILLNNLGMHFDPVNAYYESGALLSASKSGQSEGKYSSTNKYTFKDLNLLEIYSSLNDKFSMSELGELKLTKVAFTDIHVTKLLKKAYGQFDFGELQIFGLDKIAFENITLTSSYGSLRVYSKEADDLKMVLKNISKKSIGLHANPEFNMADNVQLGPSFKMTSLGNQSEIIYQKGSYKENENKKGLIHFTCDYCDLNLN